MIWMTAIASTVAVVLNIRRNRACFAIWLMTNLSWCVIDFVHEIYGQSLLQAIYAGLSVWGLAEWRRDRSQTKTEVQAEGAPHRETDSRAITLPGQHR